jgi:hypothetical protein
LPVSVINQHVVQLSNLLTEDTNELPNITDGNVVMDTDVASIPCAQHSPVVQKKKRVTQSIHKLKKRQRASSPTPSSSSCMSPTLGFDSSVTTPSSETREKVVKNQDKLANRNMSK